MSARDGKSLRDGWIANAKRLDGLGHFARYSPGQREQVLRKGYLGTLSPEQAIRIARHEAAEGRAFRTPKFLDEMREFGAVGEEVRETILSILDELPPEFYEPPFELDEPPGSPFIFDCRCLGCEVYFKFQIKGSAKKPLVLFWSCHAPRGKRK